MTGKCSILFLSLSLELSMGLTKLYVRVLGHVLCTLGTREYVICLPPLDLTTVGSVLSVVVGLNYIEFVYTSSP